MTIEEAIEWMQEEKASFERAPDLNGCPMTEYWQKAIDVYDMAISALRQQERERNEPLTLDELRQMDGEPVWCEIFVKGMFPFYGIVHGENVTGFISCDDKPINLTITDVGAYGLAWPGWPTARSRRRGDDVKENCDECKHHDIFWGGSGCNLLNNGERCKFEPKYDAICGATNLPCVKCNPGGCNNRKEGADNEP